MPADRCRLRRRIGPHGLSEAREKELWIMRECLPACRTFSADFCLAFAVFVLTLPPAFAQDGGEGGSIGGTIAPSPSPQGAPGTSRHRERAARVPPARRVARIPRTEPAPRRSAERAGGGDSHDGTWSVSAGGACAATGTGQVIISGGRIVGQGLSGTVSRSGAVQTVGSINGLSVVSHGRMSGTSASGAYRQSDGCAGPWSGYKL